MVYMYKSRAQGAGYTAVLSLVHSTSDLRQVDPVTRRVIGHARQRHEADWLQFANWSSVQFICCDPITPSYTHR